MGAPWFKLTALANQHRIVALSSNYALYADMSNRVVEVLSAFTPNLEVYSIDESFLDLSGFPHLDRVVYGHQIRERIAHWLGLAVCVGVAPTKTLAKLTNHIAKKDRAFTGVCDLTTLLPGARAAVFAQIAVGEVWASVVRLTNGWPKCGFTPWPTCFAPIQSGFGQGSPSCWTARSES